MIYYFLYSLIFSCLLVFVHFIINNQVDVWLFICDFWIMFFKSLPPFDFQSARWIIILTPTIFALWLFVKSYRLVMKYHLKPFGNIVVENHLSHNEIHIVYFNNKSSIVVDFNKAIDSLKNDGRPILIGSWIVCGSIARGMSKTLESKGYKIEKTQPALFKIVVSKVVVMLIALVNLKFKYIPKILTNYCAWRITKL